MTTEKLSNTERIEQMLTAAYSSDWAKFESFLHDEVRVKYAAMPPITGVRRVSESLQNMLNHKLRLTDAHVINTHQTGDTVIVEYDITGIRLRDNRTFVFPCVDVYRFDGDRVAEWRVYPLFAEFGVGHEGGH